MPRIATRPLPAGRLQPVEVLTLGDIDRGMHGHWRRRDACGFFPNNIAIGTNGLASPASDSTADARPGISFRVAIRLTSSARDPLPGGLLFPR